MQYITKVLSRMYPDRKVKLYYASEIEKAYRTMHSISKLGSKKKAQRRRLRYVVNKVDHKWYGFKVYSTLTPNKSGLVTIYYEKNNDHIHFKYLE